MKTINKISCLLWFVVSVAFAQNENGRIIVSVSDAGSGRYLESAQVRLMELDRSMVTDSYGAAEFTMVPPGEYTVLVSYTGNDDYIKSINVKAGETAEIVADLKSDAPIQLDTFVVKTERDGNAAAITRQKNALNVENIISTDALGRLANDNPAELLLRLPGITSGFSTEGNANEIMIRGMSSGLTGVTIDGSELTSGGGMSRATSFIDMAASNFDEIQVTKAPTPNMSADRIGGRVNFRTKPAFEHGEKRGFSFNLGGKWSPSFFDYSPRRESPSFVPNFSARWRETFSVFGKKRNLGVIVNFSYIEDVTQSVRTISRLDQTQEMPRFMYGLERRDRVVDRSTLSGSVRVDYKFSKDNLINLTYNLNLTKRYGDRPGKFIYDTVLGMSSSARKLVSEGGKIANDSTDLYTTVLPGATYLELDVDPSAEKKVTNFIKLGGQHNISLWKLNWSMGWSHSEREQHPLGAEYNYAGTRLYARSNGIGWIIDRTGSLDFPLVTQTGGPDIYDINSYSGGTAQQEIIDVINDTIDGSVDVSRDVGFFGRSVKISTGVRFIRRTFDQNDYTRTYRYKGDSLADFVGDFDMDFRLGITGLPVFDPNKYGKSLAEDSDAWEYEQYNTEASRRFGDRYFEEDIYAAYAMGTMNIGDLSILAGVRFERTETSANGYRRSATEPTNDYGSMAEVERAYPNKITSEKSYNKFFPGIHFRYRFTNNLQARASIHTSIGRPDLETLMPGYSISTTEERVTINNPDLKPQYAYNYDVTLEYYMKPMGMITVGVFRKDLRDFIYQGHIGQIEEGVDYGFDTSGYEGWDLYSIKNGAKGAVEGIELAYSQQLYFLPGILRGLGVSVNYTKLKTSGDYSDGNEYALAGFIPETANARITYTYHPISVYVQWSYFSEATGVYASTSWLRTVNDSREIWSAGISVKLPRGFEAFLDISNLTDSATFSKREGSGSRMSTNYNGPFVSCGIGGRF